MKRLLLMTLLMVMTLTAWSYENELCYATTQEGVQVTYQIITQQNQNYTCRVGFNISAAIDVSYEGPITIPATVNLGSYGTFAVVEISSGSFSDCSGLTSITLPNSIKTIKQNAFRGCTGLTSITIPDNVTTLQSYAFQGCTGLSTVEIGSGTTNLNVYTFEGCNNISSINISAENATYDSRNNCNAIIQTSTDELIRGCNTTVIPSGVKSIGSYAFKGCATLSSIDIPSSVINIEYDAFNGCVSLASITVDPANTTYNSNNNCNAIINTAENALMIGCKNTTIPSGVAKINGGAFYGSQVESLTIPASVTSISNGAFSGCSSLNTIIIEESNTVYDSRDNCNAVIETVKNELVAGCKGTVIPNSVSSIGVNAFDNCYGLTTIVIPENVNKLCDYSFSYCKDLTSILIPESVTSIGLFAFEGCPNLTTATINCTGSGGNRTFMDCTNLSSVIIGKKVTELGQNMFGDCSSLQSIIVDNPEPPYLNGTPFFNCNLSKVVLYVPVGSLSAYQDQTGWKSFGKILEMGSILFADDEVETLCISNWDTDGNEQLSEDEAAAVTDLGSVFYDNQNIKSFDELQYFTGLTSIKANAFDGCSSLTSIIIPSSLTTIETKSFRNCIGLTSVTIPYGVECIGTSAFDGCTGLTAVSISSSVTSIEPKAFRDCSGLTSVTVKNVTPLSIEAETFTNRANATLYVPAGSKVAYEAADYWREFSTIVENISFADANVKEICVANWDTNGDGELSVAEAAAVTDIGVVFEENRVITSFDELRFFTGLTSIGYNAFRSCEAMTSIIIPGNVTDIRMAFLTCTSLKSVKIPASVTGIHVMAFSWCPNLETIHVEEGNSKYDSRENCNAIIETATNKMVKGCRNTVFPNSVTSIGSCCFEGSDITTIDIPSTVTFISRQAFRGCYGLTSIVIPNSVTTIYYGVFDQCDNLNEVYVNWETPVAITEDAFSNRTNATLYVPAGSKAAYEAADYWKEFGTIVEIISFADANVKEICVANWDTNGDGELSVAEAAAVTDIGVVFEENRDITSFDELRFFTGLTSIGYNAFRRCEAMTSIIIPGNVTDIGAAFCACTSLNSVTIPASVTGIHAQAFSWCTNLASIHVEEGNSTYDSRENCNAIITTALNRMERGCRNTVFPNSVTIIGSSCFEGSDITTIDIPSTITVIRRQSFRDCNGLTSIVIPNSVTSIEYGAFNRCDNLNEVYVNWETPVVITEDVFSNRTNATLYVPAGSKAAYETADYWKEFKTIVEMVNIVNNGDLEGTDVGCFYSRVNYSEDETILPATIVDDAGIGGSRGIVITSIDNPSATWDTQFFLRLPQTLPAGTKYRLSFDYKASQEVRVNMEAHAEPSEYNDGFDGMQFATGWQHYERGGEITEGQSPADHLMRTIAFDLSNIETATTYYLDNIVFEIDQFHCSIPESTIIPWGTEQAWEMKYVYYDEIGNEPGTDGSGHAWTDAEFDDSSWATLTGPIARDENDFSVVNTIWAKENSCYYLRRTFELSNVNEAGYYFCSKHDDNVKVWINGQQVVDAGYNGKHQYYYIPATAFVEGTNTLAIYLDDYGGGAYLDYCMANFYLLKNVETGKYLNVGDEYRAVLADEGMPVKLYKQADGSYSVYFPFGSQNQQLLYRTGEEGVFVDYNVDWAQSGCPQWTFTDAGGGHIYIQSLTTHPTYGQEAMPGTYMGNISTSNNVAGNVTSGNNIIWTVEPLPARTAAQVAKLGELITTAQGLNLDTNGASTVLNNEQSTYMEMLVAITDLQDRINDENYRINEKLQDLNKLITNANTVGVSTNEAQAVVANPSSMDVVNNAISTLRAAYISKLGEGVDGSLLPLDVTGVIINPSFVLDLTDGWSWNDGEDGPSFGFNNAEYRERTFDFHQTITGLPNGNYLLKVKGFHRPDNKDAIYSDFMQNVNNAKAKLYANDESVTLKNIAAEARESQIDDWSGIDVSYDNQQRFIPDNNNDARVWFATGYYENELAVTITDGTLTLGVRLDESGEEDWVCFDDFRLIYNKDYIINGDMEGNDVSCFYLKEPDDTDPVPSTIVDGVGKDGSRCIVVNSADNPANIWDTQFYVRLTKPLPAGTRYHLKFDYKASQEAEVHTQSQQEPGGYLAMNLLNNLYFTEEWQTYDEYGVISDSQSPADKMQTIAFDLAVSESATTYYFDNFFFEIDNSPSFAESTIIPWGTEQAWEMKYVYYDEIGNEPGTDGSGHAWTDAEFDDSSWATLTGPIARDENDFSVVNTIWAKENSCYYLRRTFNLDEVNEQGYYFCSRHDDNVKVWINGTQVVDAGFNGRCQYHHIPASAFVEGTNTMAIYLADTGDGAYLDYCMANFYLLKSVETGKYLNANDEWRAVLADEGLPVKLYKQADGSYTIYFPCGSQNQQLLYRVGEEGVFVDYNKDWEPSGCPSWTFTDAGEGHIYIQSLTTHPTYGQEAMPGTYLGNNPSSNNVAGNILDEDGMNITWQLVPEGLHTEAQVARLQELITKANLLQLNTDDAQALIDDENSTYTEMLIAIYSLQDLIFENVEMINIVKNGDLEGTDVSCFYSRVNYTEDETVLPATIVDGAGKDDSHGIVITSIDNPSATWDTQFFLRLPQTLPAGTKYRLSFDYKASQEARVTMETHAELGDHINGFDDTQFAAEWQHYERVGKITEGQSPADHLMRTIAFTLSNIETATTYYFDNIVFEVDQFHYSPEETEANRLEMADITGIAGGVTNLPISLENEDCIGDIQFNLNLPEGIDVNSVNDNFKVSYSDRLSGLTCNLSYKESEGCYIVLIYGLDTSVTGNSGNIMTISLSISNELSQGDYSLEISDIVLTKEDGTKIKPNNTQSTLTLVSAELGDANKDGDIDVADIRCIANYILGKHNNAFDEQAADANGDGDIDVADIRTIANRILHGNVSSARRIMDTQIEPQ